MTDVRMRIPVTQAEREPVAPMERLDFTLPDFTRVSWVSDDARDVWEPRLGRVTAAWIEIEWRAVAAGVRRCAIATSAPETLPALGHTWAEHGLSAVPIEMIGVNGQPYAATPVAVQAGGPFAYRLVVGRVDDVAAFGRAWEVGDDTAIGELLGYPACCRDFFRGTWVDEGMVDTTWPMAAASGRVDACSVEVAGPPLANILWRWVGARAVPHLPCRTDCEATVAFGEALVAVGRDTGFADEMDWLEEVLSWPVEWSALHGIAEIKTPVLRVSTRTDATPVRYTVQRRGTGFPAGGRPRARSAVPGAGEAAHHRDSGLPAWDRSRGRPAGDPRRLVPPRQRLLDPARDARRPPAGRRRRGCSNRRRAWPHARPGMRQRCPAGRARRSGARRRPLGPGDGPDEGRARGARAPGPRARR